MNKGYIFDLIKIENGWVICLLSFFRIGWIRCGEDNRFYKCLQFGIGKIELTFAIGWNNSYIAIDSDLQGIS